MGNSRLGRIPALDGVRAIAVLGVLIFHMAPQWLGGGFLGVDVFFVLSGFLITSLLLAEVRATGRIDLVEFWRRRARRLFPALLLVLVTVVVLVASGVIKPAAGMRGDLLASTFYAANWRFAFWNRSYFESWDDPSPVLHLWSLAIEEQFYLLFPLVVFAGAVLVRRLPAARTALMAGWFALMAGSVAAMAWLDDVVSQDRAYYGTDARAHELLVGVGLAVLLQPWTLGGRHAERAGRAGRSAPALLTIGGLAAILAAMVRLGDDLPLYYHGGSLLVSLAAAALIAGLVAGSSGPVHWLLTRRPVMALGVISYGVYLWHWPVIVVLTPERTGWAEPPLIAVQASVTLGVSILSYHLVEKPIRRGRLRRLGPAGAIVASATALSVLVGGALFVTATDRRGGDDVTASSAANMNSFRDTGGVLPPWPKGKPGPGKRKWQGVAVYPEGPRDPRTPMVGLAGDSAALTIGQEIGRQLAAQRVRFVSAAQEGCGIGRILSADLGKPIPYARLCPARIPGYQETMVARHRPRLIIWFSQLDVYDMLVGKRLVGVNTKEWRRRLFSDWDDSLKRLTRGGAKILLVLPAWYTKRPKKGCKGEFSFNPASCGRHWVTAEHTRRLYKEWAAKHRRQVTFADLAPVTCPSGPPCPKTVKGVRMRVDHVHYTRAGAKIAARHLTGVAVPMVRRLRA